jgi:HAD superfamily phosphoserine phosphatase-like hydrolase
LSEVGSSGNTALAVFDFDGTLCRENSWRVPLGWLLRVGGRTTIRTGLGIAARTVRIVDRPRLKRIALSHLDGWTRSEVDALGRELYRRHLRPALVTPALDELRRRRDEGFRVVLATNAFEFLVAPFCEAYGLNDLVAAPLEWSGDRCLGYGNRVELEGTEKLRALEARVSDTTVAWERSVAYSDDLVDAPLLTRVGRGFLVGDRSPADAVLPAGIERGDW